MNRTKTLIRIAEHFSYASQWVATQPANYNENISKAEGLIELLEVSDCGSIGGFDKQNPVKKVTGVKLYDRFIALMKKEESRDKVNEGFRNDLDKLEKFYTRLNGLWSLCQ